MSFAAEITRGQPRQPLTRVAIFFAFGGALTLALVIWFASATGQKSTPANVGYDGPTLSFEPNVGQADASASYIVRAGGGVISFSPGEVHMSLPGTEVVEDDGLCEAPSRAIVPTGLRLSFIGAHESVLPSGGEILPGKLNYMLGTDPALWQTNLPTYESIIYPGLYSGIDLTYSGSGGQLKGTYTVASGADPSLIKWRYMGAEDVSVDTSGNLQVSMNGGVVLTEQAPVAWQGIGGSRVTVKAHYEQALNGNISFGLGHYDPAYPLIIDPTLTYSTYLGGGGTEEGRAIADDTQGSAYVTDDTYSPDFPLVNAYQSTPGDRIDSFVSKLTTQEQFTPTPTPTICIANANYTVTQTTGTVFQGTNIVLGSQADDAVIPFNLPFPVQLYGQTYTVANLSTNGNMQFTTANVNPTNTCLPASGMGATIFTHWDDLDMRDSTCGARCGIFTDVSGPVGSRSLVIHWKGIRPGVPTSSVDVAVRIEEETANNRFEIIYTQVLGNGVSATVGVQNSDGTLFTQFSCNNPILQDEMILVFIRPQCDLGTPSTATPTPVATHTPTNTAGSPTGTVSTPSSTSTSTISPTSLTPTPTSTAMVTATPCPIQFSDVDENNTFYTNIRCLACRGIVSGYSDGTFRPNNPVTRGQLAKMVSNAAGFQEDPNPQIFTDVPPGHTFYDFINRLTRRGHMTGYQCGGPGEPCVNNMPYFRPFANATRGQTSKIVSNAAGFTEAPVGQTFQDVPPTHTFYAEIQRLASRNVMQGYPCGGPFEPCVGPENRPYFRPGNDVTRGQSAKIVANTFFPGCDPARR